MDKILNFDALATTPLRKAALEIAEVGYAAIDTPTVIRKNLILDGETLSVGGTHFPLSDLKRIFLVGVGKCARSAAIAIEEILGERISGGVVIDIEDGTTGRAKYFMGDHPFPTKRNAIATNELIRVLKGAEEGDLVIAVVSGGGSTLLCAPEHEKGIGEEAAIVGELFKAGADIVELNTVRKHLSRARGGFLAEYAFPAQVVALVMSDVPGDRIEFVSSGPFTKDTTTLSDAKRVLAKYEIETRCGFPVTDLIETPKADRYFENVASAVVVSSKTALDAMREAAKQLGFISAIRETAFSGEACDLGKQIAEALHGEGPRSVLLYGGESTVTIVHDGKGGRSQEVALSAARFVEHGELVVAFASDGRDNTDHAGALCDILTLSRAKELGLEPEKALADNASYRFFEEVGDFLTTGNTGSNVSDLIIAIKE